MTVQELIEFLQKCEPDYEVKVYEYDGDKGHYGPLCIDVDKSARQVEIMSAW